MKQDFFPLEFWLPLVSLWAWNVHLALTIVIKKRPVVIQDKWNWIAVVLCLEMIPLMDARSDGFSLTTVILVGMGIVMAFIGYRFDNGFSVYGVSEDGLVKGIRSVLIAKGYKSEESATKFHLPHEKLDITVSYNHWGGVARLKTSQVIENV